MNMHTNFVSGDSDRRFTQYSWKNPPPNAKEATDRLDEVGHSISDIRNQLRYWSKDNFDTSDDYAQWRESASRALTFKETEHAFLVEWLKDPNARHNLIRVAIQRESERIKREEEARQSGGASHADESTLTQVPVASQQASENTAQSPGIIEMLIETTKDSYRAGTIRPAFKQLFEKTFVIAS